MTTESLARVETDIAKSLTELNSGDAAEMSLRQNHPLARFRDPHPVFDLSCSLMSLGLTNGATAIKLTPLSNSVVVQMEMNGVYQEAATLPKDLQEPIVARFKDAARLDVTKYEEPQTGNLPTHWQNKDYDVPMSFVPTENGEQVTMRFVPKYSRGI